MLPPDFIDRLATLLSTSELQAALEATRIPRVTSFRINTLKAKRADVLNQLHSEGLDIHALPWYRDGFWVTPESRQALLDSAAYRQQAIYVQNQASMIPPLVLDPQPGERLLDLAAAPGSKTLQMACLMAQEGEIAAVDSVKSRFFRLRENLRSQGATEVRTFMKDGRGVWKHRPEYFDRVLLDAPCSSEGRFHIDDPNSYAYWSLRKIKEMVKKQRRLLISAVHALRPGGILVYSTCSMAPEENEGVLTHVLKKYGSALEVMPVKLEVDEMIAPTMSWQGKTFDEATQQARRILPSRLMEGFFVCKIRKVASTVA